METFKLGSRLYALFDKKLGGFITWMEKGAGAIFLFTSGDKAERYAHLVWPNRPLSVYLIEKAKASVFIASMLKSNIGYALLDVPPEHADVYELYDDELIRNYAIIDLRKARARMS